MRIGNKNRLFRRMLSLSIIISFMIMMLPTNNLRSVKAATTRTWTMVDSGYDLAEVEKKTDYSYYTSYYKPMDSDGYVWFGYTKKEWDAWDYDFHVTVWCGCTAPPQSFTDGATFSVKSKLYTENSGSNSVYDSIEINTGKIELSDYRLGKSQYALYNQSWFYKKDAEISWTGGTDLTLGNQYMDPGSKFKIKFWTGGGTYWWEYELSEKSGSGSDSGDGSSSDSAAKPVKTVVSKIANVKGAKAKVTVKKVNGAKEYEIRYKVGSAKKWKNAKKKSNVFTIKVTKGKKVTVQARVKNSAGYGSWSKSKSFKTDRK